MKYNFHARKFDTWLSASNSGALTTAQRAECDIKNKHGKSIKFAFLLVKNESSIIGLFAIIIYMDQYLH